ncbi:MAG TPA: DUF222 domain-containing protein [Acidimicrobiales bacterium]|nr:DUF222 domain-containing protein [Acidimicrobiales bacterium]
MVPEQVYSAQAAQIVAAAKAFLSGIAAFDPGDVPPSDCVVVFEAASRVENAAGALRLVAGARAVECGAHKEQGHADPASWLARQSGTTGKDARQGLDLARKLVGHPETRDALFEGSVSVAQAKEIARAETELPGQERELLDVARRGDLGSVREAVREKNLASTPVDELHRRQLAARRFRHWRDSLGMVCFDGALPPETGIPFVTRIEREAARRHRDAKRGGKSARFHAHAADALVALATAEGAGKRGPNTDLVIVCDLYAWRRGHVHAGEPCQVIGGGPVPVEVAKELAADAFLKVVLHDGKDVQKIHHHGRRYTAELLTALDIGPAPAFIGRACVNCRRTWGLQRDHEDPVANNGPTSYGNVRDLCYHCHTEKTERDRARGFLGPRAKARGPSQSEGGPSRSTARIVQTRGSPAESG